MKLCPWAESVLPCAMLNDRWGLRVCGEGGAGGEGMREWRDSGWAGGQRPGRYGRDAGPTDGKGLEDSEKSRMPEMLSLAREAQVQLGVRGPCRLGSRLARWRQVRETGSDSGRPFRRSRAAKKYLQKLIVKGHRPWTLTIPQALLETQGLPALNRYFIVGGGVVC